MRKLKPFYLVIGSCFIIFLLVIAFWTILPRTGTVDIPGEGVYIGQLRGTTFHGYGNYASYAVGGTSYEGYWKDGVFHGQGTLTFANGSKLTGEFVDGRISGIGQSICPEGHITEVDFGEGAIVDAHQGCDHNH